MRFKSFNLTGDGAAHTLASAAGITKCKWFQLYCGSGTMTVGGSDTDGTHGLPVVATGAQFAPPFAQSMEFYNLDEIYYFLSNTDTGVLLCAL